MAQRGEILAFFSAEQACELARITDAQLRHWDKTGFFKSPRFAENAGVFTRVYSFRDVVGLRTVGDLRRRHVPWSELRELGKWFHDRYKEPWASLRFYVAGKRLYFKDPTSGELVSATKPTGQIAHAKLVEVKEIAARVGRAFNAMKRRRRDEYGKISRRKYVADSQSVVAGTRIPTELIWDCHQDGYTTEQILSDFPTLTAQDVHAAIHYEEQERRARRVS
jgi:uncharacterized protein (DUF433 family)